jgi:ribosomal protein L11 methylase PrmA
MDFKFTAIDGTLIELTVEKIGFDESWEQLMSSPERSFEYEIDIGDDYYDGYGIRGDDALWIPYDKHRGLKIIGENDRYQSLQESLEVVKRIQAHDAPSFPKIEDAVVLTDEASNKQYLLIIMENLGEPNKLIRNLSFVPPQDRPAMLKDLQMDTDLALRAVDDITALSLCPEDEWYKSINFISGKIVDFHRFKHMPERYRMPAPDHTKEQIDELYSTMVDRYKTVLDKHGLPKWKGRIYQGFEFDNGGCLKGYESDGRTPDSYKKLPFVPLNKVAGKKVLDIGSNQGFFSFQAALHGASEVVGIEYTKQDVQAAEDIKRITQLNNVNFINGDAVEYVMNSKDHYGLVVFNSVLHQIFPNFEGSSDFMTKLASMTDYLAFETPLNHPLMKIPPSTVKAVLEMYYPIVRLLHVYDAYSSGYRANFVCYS